jgi:hypothetical protein
MYDCVESVNRIFCIAAFCTIELATSLLHCNETTVFNVVMALHLIVMFRT